MASVIRKSVLGNSFTYISNSFLSPKCLRRTQVAGMVSKYMRDKDYKRPPAFPYKEKEYGSLASIFDQTSCRIDENSKLLVVDGPVASGKKKFAQELAELFDLHYIPPAHLDQYYVNSYGYDFRSLNHKLAPHLRSFDVEDFLKDPKDKRRSEMQYLFFVIRFRQYIDAMSHILNTGQGVVMNRCVYSNYVFLETYVKHGFLPAELKAYIDQVWNPLRPDLLQPHLIIYLDTPVDEIRKNLEKRNNPIELNSPVMQPEVLKDFEYNYKFNYLQKMSKHAELLIYDNSEEIEVDIVCEDIESVNFDNYHERDEKMKDWRFSDEHDLCQARKQYSSGRNYLELWLKNVPAYECDELIYDTLDVKEYQRIWKTLPGNESAPGFQPQFGDQCLLKL